MPLYLDEIWLRWDTVADARRSLAAFSGMAAGLGYPEGVRLEAGPWFSNEEAKVVLVLDIADHAKTFGVFGAAMANGLVLRRRLTPIVEWAAVTSLLETLPAGK